MQSRFRLQKRRWGSAAALAGAFVLLMTAPGAALAAAGTVTSSMSGVQFAAGPNTANVVTYTANPAGVTITDTADVIAEASADCSGNATNTVTCTPVAGQSISSVDISLGDLNDSATGNGQLGARLSGEAGSDTLVGSDTNGDFETIEGGDGSDRINSRNVGPNSSPISFGSPVGDSVQGDDDDPGAGNDTIVTGNGNDDVSGGGGTDSISTGAGDDFADGGGGDADNIDLGVGDDVAGLSAGPSDGKLDVLQGGPGLDSLSFSGATSGPVTAATVFDALAVDLTAGTANKTNNTPESNTAGGFEDVFTDDSTDTVNGTAGSNDISTGFGNDVVNPKGGADTVSLGIGNDTADTRDGSSDTVRCGPGADTVMADQFDELTDCEAVTVTRVRPAGADLAAPTCKVTKVKKRYSRKAFFGGLRPRVTCNEATSLTAQLVVRVRRSGKVVTAKVGDLVLAERSLKLGVGTRSTRLKPSKKLGSKLGKRFKVTVKIDARDEFGNRRVVTKRVTVKAGK